MKKTAEKWPCLLGCGKTFASLESSERHEARCKGVKKNANKPSAAPPKEPEVYDW